MNSTKPRALCDGLAASPHKYNGHGVPKTVFVFDFEVLERERDNRK